MKTRKEYSRTYYLRHKDKVRYRTNQYKINNYERKMLLAAKARAKNSGLEFSLTLEDIKIPEICPYLKIPLTRIIGEGVQWTNASLDRIDNSKGYTKDNIEVISFKANSMKQHASIEDLRSFSTYVLSRY